MAKKLAGSLVHIEVVRNDLPLSCPMSNMTIWNAHPRVYLPIEEVGYATCPYCNTKYYLKDFDKQRHSH